MAPAGKLSLRAHVNNLYEVVRVAITPEAQFLEPQSFVKVIVKNPVHVTR